MRTHRMSPVSMRAWAIVALILLSVGGAVLLITAAWPRIYVPAVEEPSQAEAWKAVNDFHAAINGNNVDDALALFRDSAAITDNKSLINDKPQIRNWLLYSKLMAGLHLQMLHSEMDGEKLTWLDKAYTGSAAQNRYFILRWEAVITEGKIQSLVAMPRYLPDLK